MRYPWVVVTFRPNQTQDFEGVRVYGPFPSKVKANEWVENRSAIWRMSRVIRVVESKKDV